ncbi:MAG: 4-hydroxy-3-methylbut-2-enyl diphosphate reductase [Dehalococcoidales bacterium]|jgi:4-hydroxy-3-methylbut-2-enyl diphosphate reductase|nr:4-hydroxy-3-methylbut-2-enyl diphosphate reductase [Dehalococcoidales bacterium]MDD4230052.1 4-hydroxy-3-methylbut-2-enyl diphosphate reductase [Dehalococcoidales bacterium]MDD4465785.1 4-hydroxy-3-methylbut-2-enyl diphosphate reductase [Dehalococcoidales bacterium]MDD5401697.1 4-hydroxy-3-methylbut-2-enyl diphosphate reductase [Dehalococcoidales bacterium]
MPFEIKTASNMGFCQGVRRAIERVTEVSRTQRGVETLGALVHNRQVQAKLEENCVRAVDSIDAISSETVVISAHGVAPMVLEKLKEKQISIIDTTCPYVTRAQQAASRLHEAGYFVIVFGDAGHVEVKGIIGWAQGEGIAMLDIDGISRIGTLQKKLGLLSQTTQIPSRFADFVASLIRSPIFRDRELRIIDTICHDSRHRQVETLELARGCDLVFVIGGRHSANTRHLKEMCGEITETHLVETADEIDPSLLYGKDKVGVTAGASTDDETIAGVVERLRQISAVI